MNEDQPELLVRYIAWVIANEGVDYITEGGGHSGTVVSNFFDDQEWLRLHELAEEALNYLDAGEPHLLRR